MGTAHPAGGPLGGKGAGPLAGVRVIDLTTIVLGPLAGQILGDLGADVVKVEAPAGDSTRTTGPPPTNGMGAVFLGCNRNKRSLVLDLKQPAARHALLAVAARADVFLHNMRPAAIARLGLDYPAVSTASPRIVYCGCYGYRAEGPYGDRPAYDDMIQAVSGFAALQGRHLGRPVYASSIIVDKVVAQTAVQAILAALYHRERSGEGQAIEVPMFETMAAFNLVEHLYGRTYEPPRGPAGYPRALSPDRRPYATADGHIGVLPYTDRQWRAFFEVAGRPDLAADPRFADLESRLAHIDALYAELAACLLERASVEWLGALQTAGVPAMPVNELDVLPDDPHLRAVGFWELHDHPTEGRLRLPGVASRFSATPPGIRRLPPRLGEHSTEVLGEAGLAPADIEGLVASGAVAQAPPVSGGVPPPPPWEEDRS